jgi:hypothetical protein
VGPPRYNLEKYLMQTSMTVDEDRTDHEQAVRTSLELLRRDRSAGAVQRLEEARHTSARAWGRRRGLTMAKPGSEWWRLLGRRSRGFHPDRLPGDDHVSLWLRDRKPEVHVSQPYGLTSEVVAEMVRAAQLYGLEFTISTWPAWWNPGAVLFVEWRCAQRP